MKPKFRNLIHLTLPALIVVPALLQQASAQGNNITPDPAGNIVVEGNFDETNGSAWSVFANGGPIAPFSVDIRKGALLTGNGSFANGVTVSASAYTIHNAGSITVGGYGIASQASDTTINNEGLIQGDYDGITFQGGRIEPGSITISGIGGGSGTVNNSGIVIGRGNGIYGGNGLTVDNSASGEIIGTYGIGVYGYDDLKLTNAGTITGGSQLLLAKTSDIPIYKFSGAAVYANSNAQIVNSGEITGLNGSGISAYTGLNLTNSGSIAGQGFSGPVPTDVNPYLGFANGVTTYDNAVILNQEGGSITGINHGISAGLNLKLNNQGTITGGTETGGGSGVLASRGAVITLGEKGSIRGYQHGIDIVDYVDGPIDTVSSALTFRSIEAPLVTTIESFGSIAYIAGKTGSGIDGSSSVEIITNHGWIDGTLSAIELRGGDDVLNLEYGSTVFGDINGGEGIDSIHFHDGLENPFDLNNIVHGNIGGIETITKSGKGFAFIGGPGESFNVFTDRIEVSGGGLIINGNLASLSEGKTSIVLSNGGLLDGTGTWNADLTVTSGGLSAGSDTHILQQFDFDSSAKSAPVSGPTGLDSVGTLTINGNVSFGQESILKAAVKTDNHIRVDIIPQTKIVNGVNSDLIVQNGGGNSFDLTGVNLRISPTDINKTLTNGTYTIIDSDSPLKGTDLLGTLGVQFNSNAPDTGDFTANQSGSNNLNTVLTKYFTTVHVTDPAPVALEVGIAAAAPDSSDLELRVQHDFAGLPGLSRNEAAIAAAIDASVGSANPLLQDFIAALDYSDLAAVQDTLASLDPGNVMGLANAVVNSNYRLHRMTQDHLAAIRGTGKSITETGASSKDAKGVITAGETTTRLGNRGNTWGSISYDEQDYDSSKGADFDGDGGAFTAGFDWLVAPQLVLGIVLDGSKSDYDGSSIGSDVDSFRGAVYGTWGSGEGFYSDALVGYGTHDLNSNFGGAGVLGGSIGSDTEATSLQALWTAGYTMVRENVKHGPFAGLEYQNVDVDGYDQSGPLPISAGGFDVDSLRALIGYRANASFGQFRPYASLAYAHEFEDGSNTQSASFAGTSFTVEGAEQGSAFLISVGTGYALTESLTLDLGYRGEIATDDGISSNGGSLGVNYSF